jgi:HPr kinase/phosphorylase
MFISNKKLFNEYYNWLFDILFELESRIDISEYDDYNKRIYGFLSERLFNVWLEYKNLKVIGINGSYAKTSVKNILYVLLAEKYNVPIYRTSEMTSEFVAGLTQTLSVALAKRITRHGVLVEVYGEGVLLYGDSGVGKSEVAMELIKRGHRLIADDAVEIRRVSNRSLVGTSPENIRHFMELRGVGIINARNLFGMGAVKKSAKLDMIINLEPWDNDKVYDRMGATDVYTKVLDVDVPLYTIPVQPGRNIAVIVEVAAMNNRQKRMGNNAALELMERLMIPESEYDDDLGEWDSYYGLD